MLLLYHDFSDRNDDYFLWLRCKPQLPSSGTAPFRFPINLARTFGHERTLLSHTPPWDDFSVTTCIYGWANCSDIQTRCLGFLLPQGCCRCCISLYQVRDCMEKNALQGSFTDLGGFYLLHYCLLSGSDRHNGQANVPIFPIASPPLLMNRFALESGVESLRGRDLLVA